MNDVTTSNCKVNHYCKVNHSMYEYKMDKSICCVYVMLKHWSRNNDRGSSAGVTGTLLTTIISRFRQNWISNLFIYLFILYINGINTRHYMGWYSRPTRLRFSSLKICSSTSQQTGPFFYWQVPGQLRVKPTSFFINFPADWTIFFIDKFPGS